MYKRVFSICVIIVLWASSLWAQSADALLDELARTTSERSKGALGTAPRKGIGLIFPNWYTAEDGNVNEASDVGGGPGRVFFSF